MRMDFETTGATMSRRTVWAYGGCIVVTILFVALLKYAAPTPDLGEWQPRHQGVMEKKFKSLKDDMTRAEVEAILGAPTGCSLFGGSLSTCEQYYYVWRGDDGLIAILFAKRPHDEFAPYGPPGMENRIMSMGWQPSVNEHH